jgi:hypothetical protein
VVSALHTPDSTMNGGEDWEGSRPGLIAVGISLEGLSKTSITIAVISEP